MTRLLLPLGSGLLLVFLAACVDKTSPAPAAEAEVAAPQAAMVATSSALAEFDRMDGRTPVPLLPMMANHQLENMRDHLLAVQEIVAALVSDDFAGVERAASRIGFSEQMGQMCSHMGAAAPGFTEQALDFHHTADRISEAARQRDRTRVLTELGATLQTCVSCHAAWKQQVVDEPTWKSLTSLAPPTHGSPH